MYGGENINSTKTITYDDCRCAAIAHDHVNKGRWGIKGSKCMWNWCRINNVSEI